MTNTPWIDARYSGECKGCGATISRTVTRVTSFNGGSTDERIRCADPACRAINRFERTETTASDDPN